MKYLIIAATFLALSFPTTSIAQQPSNEASHDVIVNVNGLVCDFCARAVEKVFGRQEEVASIAVDMNEKTVVIYFNEGRSLDDAAITDLINDSGYSVESIQHAQK